MIIDELITLLGFDITGEEKARAYAAINKNLNSIAIQTSAAIGALGISIFGAAKKISFAVGENYEWARSNGVAFESMQRLEAVTNAVGGDIRDAQNFMTKWARVAAVSGRSIEDILEEVSQRFKGIPAEQQKVIAQGLGYGEAELRVFQMSAEQRKQILKSVSTVQERDGKTALEYTFAWRNATLQISRILETAVSSSLPEIKSVVDELSRFITVNKDLVTSGVHSFFKATAIAVRDIIPAIVRVSTAFVGLMRILGNLKILTLAVYAIVGLWATSLALKTVTGIISVVSGTKQMIASIHNVITAIGAKISAMQYEMVTQKLNEAATLKGVLAETALKNAVNIERLTTWQFIKAKTIEIGLKIKGRIEDLKEIGNKTLLAVAKWKEKVATDAHNISLTRSNILTWKNIAAGLKAIAVFVLQTAKIIFLTIAYVAYNAVMLVASAGLAILTAAQWALNVAMDANPIGLIIVSIAALIAIVVVIIKYWRQILAFLQESWNWIMRLYDIIVGSLIKAFEWCENILRKVPSWAKYLLVLLGPIGVLVLAVLELRKAFSRIMNIGIVEYFKELWGTAIKAWDAVKGVFGFSSGGSKNKSSQPLTNRAPVSSTVINQTKSNVANNQRQNVTVNVTSPAAAETTMKRLNILNTSGLRA